MSIRYYKLFDLLNRRNMKKSDLRQILSSSTVAKLSKGEYISGEAIEKICNFLHCQPGDIMEFITEKELENGQIEITVPQLNGKDYIQWMPKGEEPENGYRLTMEYLNQIQKFDEDN